MQIEKDMLLSLVTNYIKENSHENNDFIRGVKGTLDMLKKSLKKEITLEFTNEFKSFALENFLDNDQSKLETFESLMHLYVIKMSQLTRTSTWNIEPEDLDLRVFNTLKKCFDGINITRTGEDYDRDAVSIFLNVYYEKPNGNKSYIEVTENGDFEEKGEENTWNENYYALSGLENHLQQAAHYELLLLFTCLKKFYQYINSENVKKLLEEELAK